MKLEYVVHVSRRILLLQIVAAYRIGASAIDNEFKLLTDLYVDLHGKQRIFRASAALDFLTPSAFSRALSELSKNLHGVDVAKVELTSVEIDRSAVHSMPFDLLKYSDTSVGSLKLAYTLVQNFSVLAFIGLPNGPINFHEAQYFLSGFNLSLT